MNYKLNKSQKGSFSNVIVNNDILEFILQHTISNRISDIFIIANTDVTFKKHGISSIKGHVPEDIFKDIKFDGLITEEIFSNILGSIFPNKDDKEDMISQLNDKKAFDYGIGYEFKYSRDIDGKEINFTELVRLRLNFINTVEGIMITIRPLINLGLTYNTLTSLKWATNLGQFNIDENNKKNASEKVIAAQENALATLKKMEQVSNYIRADFDRPSGLILVTGTTGSGKSTLVTSILEDVLKNTNKHIITFEDPIEYILNPGKGKITQIEVGSHIATFSDGIRGSKRENPDIVYIQEIRDKESGKALMELLGSGVLVITTLHTGSVTETMDRLLYLMSDGSNESYVRNFLSRQLISIINQKLVHVTHTNQEGVKNSKIKGIQEYLRNVGQAKAAIKENKPTELESEILDSNPPNRSVTKILWYFYLLEIINIDALLNSVNNIVALENLIVQDKDIINTEDAERILLYFGTDSFEKLKG